MDNGAYLSLGSNQGDRLKFLRAAIQQLECKHLNIKKCSHIYETEPQNFVKQPDFLNCVLLIETAFGAIQLLEVCKKIEQKIGKDKKGLFGPRNIDIDMLTFNDEEILLENLIIPHARMHERHFVLAPLKEIAPDFKIKNIHIDQFITACSYQKATRYCASL